MKDAATIDQAFIDVPRKEFLPQAEKPYAQFDQPLYIGYGQTNSQPQTVRDMLEWLDVQAGNKVLDVGSGSGWTTALLARLTGSKGRVTATERVPELLTFGEANCRKLNLNNVAFAYDSSTLGWPAGAPYDRILVSAAADELPVELAAQLADGGIMVVPIANSIWEIEKQGDKLIKTEHTGYIFVPLL